MSEQPTTDRVSDERLAELAGAYWPDGAAVFGSEIRACLQELQRLRSPGGARVEPVLYDKSRPQCACCGSTDPEHVKRICDANLPGEPGAKP